MCKTTVWAGIQVDMYFVCMVLCELRSACWCRFDKMHNDMRDLQQEKRYLQNEMNILQDRLTQYALQAAEDSTDASGGPLAAPSAGATSQSRGIGRRVNIPKDELIEEVLCYSILCWFSQCSAPVLV